MSEPGGGPGSGKVITNEIAVNALTLRDYFAAQSMMMIFVVADRNDSEISNEGMAKVAYHIADCMLAERAK